MNTTTCFATLSKGTLLAVLLASGSGCSHGQAASEPAPAADPNASKGAAPATPVATPTPEQLKAKRREALIAGHSGREHIVSKEELTPLGSPDELTEALASIYADESVALAVRVSALASLRFFPSPTSKELLEKALVESATPDPARRVAVKAYGEGFKDEAVPLLTKMLDHTELHTRNAAARTLGDIGTPPAKTALRKRLPSEPDPMVKATIKASLKK